jgi:hypothetical protein
MVCDTSPRGVQKYPGALPHAMITAACFVASMIVLRNRSHRRDPNAPK